jgi:hypothetical protein
MDDEQPPVRRLKLKAKDVVPTDKVARAGDGSAISVQLMHRLNKLAEDKAAGREPEGDAPHPGSPPRLTAIPFRPRRGVPELGPPADVTPAEEAPADESITVQDMLRVAAQQSEPELIAMPKAQRSRRYKDFGIVLAGAGGATAVLLAFFRHEPEMLALGFFGIAFTTMVLGWIIFGAMDKY